MGFERRPQHSSSPAPASSAAAAAECASFFLSSFLPAKDEKENNPNARAAVEADASGINNDATLWCVWQWNALLLGFFNV